MSRTPDRLPLLRPEQLDSAQRELHDRITRGPRSRMLPLTDADGALIGPFNAWLYTPQFGARLDQLGLGIPEDMALPARQREIAILVSARHHRAQFEWFAHERLAARAGLAPEVIAAIHAGEAPSFEEEGDAEVFALAVELLETHRVSDAVYDAARDALGERELVELVLLLGYYAKTSMVLNTFRVALPEGTPLPFPEADGEA